MFSPRVNLCACGHAFCTGCAIVHKEEEGAGLKAFCLECKKIVTTDLIEIKPSLLRQMRFVCSRGREGTLEKIKEHLWESAESHNVTDVASKGSIDGPFGAESLLHSLRDEVLSLKLQLRTLVGVATRKYFWVDLQKIIDEHEESRQKTITSNVEPWEVCGYACGFFYQISEHDNECYVDVSVRTMSNNTSLSPWPMKKRCIFALYDISGRQVNSSVSLLPERQADELMLLYIAACGHAYCVGYAVVQ
ncbi:uncharacterized protein LOC111273511 [Varroa jacobsoni]|uniref:uncharacterized protein LOC111273511 n=1 Tax=Varroa jacobsoni TaxID=62625 RepID=UPI000BF6A583|nr:uncharacterized protein LOC111273511 [Varroa jacobsoni]